MNVVACFWTVEMKLDFFQWQSMFGAKPRTTQLSESCLARCVRLSRLEDHRLVKYQTGFEGPVNGALLCNLLEPPALRVVKVAIDKDL